MKISQVLHKNIPQKKKIFMLIEKEQQQDISKFLLQTIKSVKKDIKDIRMINLFCIEIHDMLHHSIISRKIRIAKKILRLFEWLALPISYMGEQKRGEILKKICKVKI